MGTRGNTCRGDTKENREQWSWLVMLSGRQRKIRGGYKILLELNSLSVFMFNLCHDSIGVKWLSFLLHTVLWKQVCRCITSVAVTKEIWCTQVAAVHIREKLTLVVDEAMGGEQFERVDLEQDSVEQEVVSCRTELGVVMQTRLGELLQEQ